MKSTDPEFPVGKHFKLKEFTRSQTALRKGIDNTPTNEIVVRLKRLCEYVLDPLREALGPVSISSGYRSPALNRAVGGSNSSQHMFGMAADINVSGVSDAKVQDWILKNCEYDQLINEFPPSGWTHVSYVEGKNRKQYFRIG